MNGTARALIAVGVVWAAIYLPGLGAREIKGEEGRRILPAVAMLETGNWVVPEIGGAPYLRKPPLINWAIAGAFAVTGSRGEWAARLPSVVAVLVLAVGMVVGLRRWLGAARAGASALVVLTSFAMIDKGRLAEIEAVYVALTGLAMVAWMGLRGAGASGWWAWPVAWFFLGLGLLAKGPLHLLFFYGVVAALVAGPFGSARGWREFVGPSHFAGLAVGAAVFLAWFLPYREATRGLAVGEVWAGQTVGRFTGAWSVSGWLLNLPRGLSDFLPWTLAVPLWWRGGVRREPWVDRLRWGVAVAFVGMLVVPGVLPRYAMPLLVPAAVLVAATLPEWRGGRGGRWLIGVVGVMAAGLGVFGFASGLWWGGRGEVREAGRAIDRFVRGAGGERLVAVDPGFFPALYYVTVPLVYLADEDDLGGEGGIVLGKERLAGKLAEAGREVEELGRVRVGEGKPFLILRAGGGVGEKRRDARER